VSSNQPNRTEYLLQEMRCASLRARLMAADLDAVGLALKGALVTPDQAVELLADCDVLHLVGTEVSPLSWDAAAATTPHTSCPKEGRHEQVST
jgi:hypothetical protein